MKSTPILPSSQSSKILQTCFLIPIFGCFAVYKSHYDFAIWNLLVFLTSVNYWRHPVHGLRRNVDILVALFACVYHVDHYFLLSCYQQFVCWTLALSAVACYVLAVERRSHICHIRMHILGNLANACLYWWLNDANK